MEILRFDSDYMEGCHPAILENLQKINYEKKTGYGLDEISNSAKEKIRKACECPEAEVHFLVGGTQTNSIAISALLKPYESVISCSTGHITDHEAGAIESKGHKVIILPNYEGKISSDDIDSYMENFCNDENNQHMVKPGLVYISFPTEFGTVYELDELKSLRKVCDKYNLKLYLDGARLGYGLAASKSVTLQNIASICDAFYIGGTKVGALFGEALIFTKKNLVSNFFTQIKQNGALLAKGWLLGIQFDTLFSDDLYFKISKNAVDMAQKLEKIFVSKGYKIFLDSPSNQKFFVLENSKYESLRKVLGFSFWQKYDENHTVVRFATSWATTQSQIDLLEDLI